MFRVLVQGAPHGESIEQLVCHTLPSKVCSKTVRKMGEAMPGALGDMYRRKELGSDRLID